MVEQLKNKLKQLLLPKSKLVILNYHQLGRSFNPKLHNRAIWNSIDFFEEQMTYLKQNFKILPLKDGVEALKNNSINQTIICITFDDGDASITSLAMPLLEAMQIPATFFINTAYGKEKVGYWYNLGPYFEDKALIDASFEIRNTLNPKRYKELLQLEEHSNTRNAALDTPFYANYKELERCSNSLFHFGLHGHEHLRFSMLTYEEQKQNLLKNMESMSHWSNFVPFFAIPFGQPKDWNADTLKLAEELNVIPFLAYQGYNTSYKLPLLRFSVDGKELSSFFKHLSPFQKTYYKLNNLNL